MIGAHYLPAYCSSEPHLCQLLLELLWKCRILDISVHYLLKYAELKGSTSSDFQCSFQEVHYLPDKIILEWIE